MPAQFDTLHVEIDARGVALLTLNRPAVLNAFNRALFDDLTTALESINDNEAARVVVITGAGDRAFSAGGDIGEMSQATTQEQEHFAMRFTECCWTLANYRLPTIGAINGLAYGGGGLLATALDIRIGCERSKFKFLGVQYDRINATWSLPMIVGWPHAKELLFSARVVAAEEALRLNLLNHVVPAERLMESTMALALQIAGNPPRMVQGAKQILTAAIGASWEAMLEIEQEAIQTRLAPGPAKESFAAFLERKSD